MSIGKPPSPAGATTRRLALLAAVALFLAGCAGTGGSADGSATPWVNPDPYHYHCTHGCAFGY